MSRTPVREACRQLEREGFVQIIPFKGYFIAPLTIGEFHNLQEIQLVVDPAAAALAAQRASPDQVKMMEDCAKYEYRVGSKRSYYEFLQLNRRLHVGIAEATGNDHLAQIVANLHSRLMRYFFLGLSLDSYGPQLVIEHVAIVQVIKARDPEAARLRTTEHILNTIRRSAALFQADTEAHPGERSAVLLSSREIALQSTVQWVPSNKVAPGRGPT